ncbi:MAG TPA: hypothetical protein VMB25_19255 [Bryobacteraceae bacterium]|nr:hypothetical protein [Bryobacteraceae bacterium]
MRCRYCKVRLAPLRSLTDGEFCCDDHRHAYEQEHPEGSSSAPEPEAIAGLFALEAEVEPAASAAPAVSALPALPAEFTPDPVCVSSEVALARQLPEPDLLLPLDLASQMFNTAEEAPWEAAHGLEFPGAPQLPAAEIELAEIPYEPVPELPAEPAAEPEPLTAFPEAAMDAPADNYQAYEAPAYDAEDESSFQPLEGEAAEDLTFEEEESGSSLARPAREVAASWRWLSSAWKNAPRDLKVVTVLLPLVMAVALSPTVPKVKVALPKMGNGDVQQVQKALTDRWKSLNQTISNRAAIAFADDFRSGLDAWESRSNMTTSWSYDQAGFVRPGPLALFKPSMELTDYHFEFLGEIDQKALGWVFRAQDLQNYYAMKLVVVRPGPLPLVHLVRYAMVNGKETSRADRPLPMTVRADMLYRILVDVHGGDFTVMTQGQVVDFWSDDRLRHGGVGFFCGRGERARLRWVEVSHQYDALGKLCAYLAPYGMEGRNGNIN